MTAIGPAAPLRGPTSRTMLEIDWKYPSAPSEPTAAADRSTAVRASRVLPLAEAFPILAGDDPRPLLVLRECLHCNGTDDALLTKGGDNERTLLMSRWFRCVKLPPAVLEADHPLHALFGAEDTGHLFVSAADGSGRHDLNGQQSRPELWGAMEKLLATQYAEKHEPALKGLFGTMDELDAVDSRLMELRSQLEDEIEDDGPDSRGAKKLRKKIAELVDEKNELVAQASELQVLPLKDPTPPAAPKAGL